MSLPDSLGRPVTDLEDYLEPEPRDPCATTTPDVAAQRNPSPRRLRLVTVAVAATAVLALASGVAWATSRPVAAPATPTVAERPPAGLTGFAELYVTTYLTAAGAGQLDALDPFLAAPVDLGAMTAHRRYIPHAAAIEVARLGPGYWRITVAAEVLERRGDGYAPAGVHHYAVAVAEAPSGLIATALPARVAPVPPVVPAGTYGDLRVEADAELVAFAGGFVDALLAGSGMLPRFVTADSDIEPLTPVPYAAAKVVSVSEGTVAGARWVTITATGTTASGVTDIVSSTLRLAPSGDALRADRLLPGPPPLPEPDRQ
jgi:hypothetical protein